MEGVIRCGLMILSTTLHVNVSLVKNYIILQNSRVVSAVNNYFPDIYSTFKFL